MLSFSCPLSQIAQWTGAQCCPIANRTIHTLLTDSRSLSFPESTLFFALKTAKDDGHKYIHTLYQRGVRSFVVSHIPKGDYAEASMLVVKDTLAALQSLAQHHRQQFHIPVIGIAGSNGKTTVKEWLYQLLVPHYAVTRSPRSYNSQVGVALSVCGLGPETQVGIFETGISQMGEMARLEAMVQPTIGIFTCLGDAHQEHFQSMAQKCSEKLQLFAHSQVLFYPKGDPIVEDCLNKMQFQGKRIACPTTGDALKDNATLCQAVAQWMGLSREQTTQAATKLQPVAMRLEVLEGNQGCTIINDTYNSDLKGLDIALDFMNRRTQSQSLKKMAILSDMEQMAVAPAELHTQMASLLSRRGIQHMIGVGPMLTKHIKPFQQVGIHTHTFPTTESLLASPLLQEIENTLLLVKGARSFQFDRLSNALAKKVHQTILEVDLRALVDNLNHYRAALQPGVKMVCMVKADAYGAGAIEVSRVLQEHHVDYLAVAVADEGIALRRAGITMGILVMNPEIHSLGTLFDHQLEPEVYSFRLLQALIAQAEKQGVQNFPIHIKLDTGMHRLGFTPETDITALAHILAHQTALQPRSVFTHFVGSDSDEFDAFSATQIARFNTAADILQATTNQKILRHICNSAGITHFPDQQMDMVRLGIGLYGIDARTNHTIHNISTLKTTILQIHNVAAGESIGYSRRTILERDSRIASIPIGYADGLDRLLGNRRGYCLVNGQPAPYVGNICMDVCMIDVTEIPCEEGDTAVIFGNELPPALLSDAIHTIPYEILTSVSPRVKRIYFKDR